MSWRGDGAATARRARSIWTHRVPVRESGPAAQRFDNAKVAVHGASYATPRRAAPREESFQVGLQCMRKNIFKNENKRNHFNPAAARDALARCRFTLRRVRATKAYPYRHCRTDRPLLPGRVA